MKATELMIGDWVQFHTEHYEPYSVEFVQRKISNFNKYGLIYFDDCMAFSEEEGIYQKRQYDKIEPIPLTEEIFKANGFDNEYKFWQSLHYNDNNIVYYNWTNNHLVNGYNAFGEFVKNFDLYIKTVHELQHALRLCGLRELADNFKLK